MIEATLKFKDWAEYRKIVITLMFICRRLAMKTFKKKIKTLFDKMYEQIPEEEKIPFEKYHINISKYINRDEEFGG
jgi:hypothetical protein